MSGDWIKFELATSDKPEVWEISETLELDPDAVVGKLLRVWAWFDQHTEKGNAPSVTKKLLDRNVGVTGFCDSLIEAGWMQEKENQIFVTNFDRHNGQTAKTRAVTAKRVAKHKASNGKGNGTANDIGNGVNVTGALPKEEKRRSNKKETKKFLPPTVGEVQEYCLERKNGIDPEKFIDHYAANGWMRGKNKIKDWKACVRTWEQRQSPNTQASIDDPYALATMQAQGDA